MDPNSLIARLVIEWTSDHQICLLRFCGEMVSNDRRHKPEEKENLAKLLNWGRMIAIVGYNETCQFYNGSGVIKANQCDSTKQNHAVVLSGYDFSGFTPYYWIRNSWGSGVNGYEGTNAWNEGKTCTGDYRNVETVQRTNYGWTEEKDL